MQPFHSISEKIREHLNDKRPFVVYAKPESQQVVALFQKNRRQYQTKDFTETGFVFAPFDGKQPILIPEEASEVVISNLVFANADRPEIHQPRENKEAKPAFEKLVQKGIDAIENNQFSKVVLSRKEIIALDQFNAILVFERLLKAYPTAFRYCWFHPEIGLWMGATPEKILQASDGKFHTMALAGTQPFKGSEKVVWEEKEKSEQLFVTDFIREALQNVVSEMVVSEPYTARAGNLLHLKTDIEGILGANASLKNVLDILHPTPAVCGFPKAAAKQFIQQNEGYDREYYSGFLGEINKDFTKNTMASDLYVNLRCMQVKHHAVHLYMGCGITKDSIPEKEFTETVNKSLTIKKIL